MISGHDITVKGPQRYRVANEIFRNNDLMNRVDVFKSLVNNSKVLKIFAFANNHYAGHGPATIKLFWASWKEK